MTRKDKSVPGRSETGHQQDRERQARLSDALRQNLLKRKAQQRARTGPGAGGAPDERQNSAAGAELPVSGRKNGR